MASNQRGTSTKAKCTLSALHKSQLGLQSWLWQVPCTLTLHTSLPPPLNDDDDDDDDDVFCDDDHDDDDDDDHDGGVSHGSLSLPSRLQALLRLWLPLHTSPGLLPLLRLQEPLRQWRSQVPLKLTSLRMTLRTQRLHMPLGLHKSPLELQSWSWPALCKLALHKSQLGLQSWSWPARCTLTLHMLLPSLRKSRGTQRLQMLLGLHKSQLELQSWSWPALCTLVLRKSRLGLQSWWRQALCTLTLHTSLPLPEPLR